MSTITVNTTLALVPIKRTDQPKLLTLMMDLYRPVYQHLWQDDGSMYVHSQFNIENLKTELAVAAASYYFINFDGATVGILRFVTDFKHDHISETNTTKLHRIYLHPTTHGKGLGNMLINWLVEHCRSCNQQSIWLECMDTQLPALHFYKKMGFEIINDFRLQFPTMVKELRGMHTMKLQLH